MHTSSPIENLVSTLRARGYGPRPSGTGYSARCPAHDDRSPSLSITPGDDGRALVRCHAGCDTRDIVSALGMQMRELFAEEPPHAPVGDDLRSAIGAYTRSLGPFSNRWDYHDRDGQRVGIVLRWDTQADGKGGKEIRPVSLIEGQWRCGGMPAPRPIYRLPEVLRSEGPVLVCEGEKASDAAVACGYAATTSPHGSKSPGACDWSALQGREVVLVPDLDEAGRAYAHEVAGLLSGVAASVRIVDLRDGWGELGDGDDLDDALRLCGADAERARAVMDGLIEDAPIAHCEPAGAQAASQSRSASVRPIGQSDMSEHEPRAVRWLVDGRVAMGKLNMLAGDPGLGKSFVTLELAARVSRGECGTLPDGSPGRTVLLSAEDDPGDTLAPRLIAMGADRSRITLFHGFLDRDGYPLLTNLGKDAVELGKWVESMGDVSLIVIDPISAYMGETDTHKNAEVRGVLGRLAKVAEHSGAAVVCVTHLNKDSGSGKKAIYRTMGSLAFTAAARVVQLVTKYEGPDDSLRDTRVVSMVKNNLGPNMPAMLYSIQDGKLAWHDEQLPGDADVFASGQASFVSGETKADRAAEFLEKELEGGSVAARLIFKRAEAEGLNEKLIRDAKKQLGVISYKQGTLWFWSRDGQIDSELLLDSIEPTPEQLPQELGRFGTY